MGIFDKLMGGSRTPSQRPIYVLTDRGKRRSEDLALPEKKYLVLVSIQENGPSTLNEIAKDKDMDPEVVKAILKSLAVDGLVQKRTSQEQS